VDEQALSRSFSIVPERAAAAAARKVSHFCVVDGWMFIFSSHTHHKSQVFFKVA